MVEITFQTAHGGTYWVICECLSHYDGVNGYDLDNVLENSRGTGPCSQMTVPPDWRIQRIKEV